MFWNTSGSGVSHTTICSGSGNCTIIPSIPCFLFNFSIKPSNFFSEISSGNFNKKIKTLLIFVSITTSGKFQAKEQIAHAVYGQIHGNSKSKSIFHGNSPLYFSTTS